MHECVCVCVRERERERVGERESNIGYHLHVIGILLCLKASGFMNYKNTSCGVVVL